MTNATEHQREQLSNYIGWLTDGVDPHEAGAVWEEFTDLLHDVGAEEIGAIKAAVREGLPHIAKQALGLMPRTMLRRRK